MEPLLQNKVEEMLYSNSSRGVKGNMIKEWVAWFKLFEKGTEEEGSENSEKNVNASVGINLSSSQKNSCQISNEKRKRIGICDMTDKKRKIKVPPSKQIANTINRIAFASELYSVVVSTLVVSGLSIGDVMTEIQKIEAITNNPNWHFWCYQLMMQKQARKIFVALKDCEKNY
ncbi:hypothetical protein HN873_059190 [Arachis hypogaea]